MALYPDKLTALFAKQIDCSGDPLNVTRPGQELADLVAEQAMARPDHGHPHIVNFGEVHNSVSNILLQLTFLEGLRTRHPHLNLAVGLEFAENFPLSRMHLKYNLPQGFNAFFCYASPLPYLALALTDIMAPLTHLSVAAHLDEHQIPCALTDAPQHPFRRRILVREGKLITELETEHPSGMTIRNAAMHGNLMRVATKHKADIAVQFVGSGHVFGERIYDNAFDGTLVDLADKKGYPHTAVIIDAESLDFQSDIPDDTLKCRFLNAVNVTGLYPMNPETSFEVEETVIHLIARRSGFTPPDIEAWKVKAQASIQKDLQETSKRMGKTIEQLTPRGL